MSSARVLQHSRIADTRTAMVRTGGIVLSMVLLSLCLALCGCGGGDAPTPAPTTAPNPVPTPAPTPAPISPEVAWQRYKTAFKENNESTLLEFRSSPSLHDIFQLEVICYKNADNEDRCGRETVVVTSICNRTSWPDVLSEEFDQHPTRPDDYRIGTLVWRAGWKGSTGVVADSFGVDILVFVRQIDPETMGEDWRVKFHVQVVDSNPDAIDPIDYDENTPCAEDLMEQVCEKDLNSTVALFKDNAVIRSYDKEGDATVNGMFIKDQFVNFFEATKLFTTDFPVPQINAIRGGSRDIDFNIDVLAGPRDNSYTKYPRRFVSLAFRDNDEKHEYQYLARWTWANVTDRATSHVEHI